MSTEQTPHADAGAFSGFDHLAENHRIGAPCEWARMREASELPISSNYGGFRVITKYVDAVAAGQNWRVFSSALGGVSIPSLSFGSRHIPVEVDPPQHRDYRGLLSAALTRENVLKMEPVVREITTGLLDEIGDQTRVDFTQAFARPLPVRVTLALLGLPWRDSKLLDGLVAKLHSNRGNQEASETARALDDYVSGVLNTRRAAADRSSNDIISSLLTGTVDGRPLTHAEQLSIVRIVIIGGFDTTAIALTTAVWWLAEHPEALQRLRGNAPLLDRAIDEFVRYASPAAYLGRTVAEDIDFGGSRLKRGDKVLISWAAANRDPQKFSNPEEVILDRSPNHHLAFGAGVHSCIGLHLAKLELHVALQEILTRYKSLRVNSAESIKWESSENQGMVSLPLILERAS